MLRSETKFIVFLFLGLILLLFSCRRREERTGVTGNYYTISVEAPRKVKKPSFRWSIVRLPEESQLGQSDLLISDSADEVTFSPDQPGRYELEVTVFDEHGDEAGSQLFAFDIEAPPEARIEASADEEIIETSRPSEGEVSELPGETPGETYREEQLEETDETGEVALEAIPPTRAIDELAKVATPEEKLVPATVPEEPAPGSDIPKVLNRFTIQLSSWRLLQEAQEEADQLSVMGFDAYVQKAYFSQTDEIWFRVRVGSFDSPITAAIAVKEIEAASDRKGWVDNVRVEF